jgi:DNA primase
MSKTPYVDFKAVKTAITMEQVLAHYHLLDGFKRSGDSLSGPCPIHKGTNPTQFRVSMTKNLWNCFSECKHGGNVLDFIAEMEKSTIHAAALKAIEWFEIDTEAVAGNGRASSPEDDDEHDESRQAAPKSRQEPEEPATPNKPLKFRLDKLQREHPYLTERGLTTETLVDFGAGYCTKGMMVDRIAIPIHNEQGEVVAYAGRFAGVPPEGTPKYKLPQGFRKSLELFNIDRASKEPAEKPLIIVEGFFGCMTLHQHGFRKVVALMGSSLSTAQEEIICRHVSKQSQVILMLDEDEAGQAGREEIAGRLAKHCFVRIHQFEAPATQPEELRAEDLKQIVGGAA